MLELRPTCENCDVKLLPSSTDAMICSYECTFSSNCVQTVFYNVCPNCGGGFVKRPIRRKVNLFKDRPVNKKIYKPVSLDSFQMLLV